MASSITTKSSSPTNPVSTPYPAAQDDGNNTQASIWRCSASFASSFFDNDVLPASAAEPALCGPNCSSAACAAALTAGCVDNERASSDARFTPSSPRPRFVHQRRRRPRRRHQGPRERPRSTLPTLALPGEERLRPPQHVSTRRPRKSRRPFGHPPRIPPRPRCAVPCVPTSNPCATRGCHGARAPSVLIRGHMLMAPTSNRPRIHRRDCSLCPAGGAVHVGWRWVASSSSCRSKWTSIVSCWSSASRMSWSRF